MLIGSGDILGPSSLTEFPRAHLMRDYFPSSAHLTPAPSLNNTTTHLVIMVEKKLYRTKTECKWNFCFSRINLILKNEDKASGLVTKLCGKVMRANKVLPTNLHQAETCRPPCAGSSLMVVWWQYPLSVDYASTQDMLVS